MTHTKIKILSGWLLPHLAFLVIGTFAANTVHAEISFTGDYSPAPANWNSSTFGYIGNSAAGTATIDSGSQLSSSYGYLGYNSGSMGVATVDGAGSMWTNRDSLLVGYNGTGTLNITNGGAVSSNGGDVGLAVGAKGVATVNGAGSTWTNSSSLYVGDDGRGTLNIINGGTVSNTTGYLGYFSYSSVSQGVATVDGTGSTWTNSDGLYVGYQGTGTLNISNGGAVTASAWTVVGEYTGSKGMINFGPGGGTLTTQALSASPTQLMGTGTIYTHGLVSDVNLTFDSTHRLAQSVAGFGNVAMNLDMSDFSNVGGLGAGWNGNGSLVIQEGIAVNSQYGNLGANSGSTGVATVDGSGSKWTNSGALVAGSSGMGTLKITNGGTVSNTYGYLGCNSGSTGVATVDGAGSMWTNSSVLDVAGSFGMGTLKITNGGAVSNSDGYLGYYSGSKGVATVDGTASTWTNSGVLYVGYGSGGATLNISNGGAVSNIIGYLGYSLRGMGYNYPSIGGATVDGPGSTWTNNGTLYVGYAGGTGTLNITNGGAVLANALIGGNTITGMMALNFDGGILRPYNADNPNWISKGSGAANVYVKERGATFDTSGYNMGITLPLQHGGSNPSDGGLTKLGAGTLTLSGANTYTGDTTVVAGSLLLSSAGSIQMDINNSTGDYSQFLGTGGLDLEGALKLDVGDVTDNADSWQLVVDTLGSTTYGSTFAIQTTTGGTFTGGGGILGYINGSRLWIFTESTGVLTLSPVPEPASLVLLVIGSLAASAYCFRRR